MQVSSCARCHFPLEIIRHVIWFYIRLTLSYRDAEELLAEGDIEDSYQAGRGRVLKFGPVFARNLRQLRPRASDE